MAAVSAAPVQPVPAGQLGLLNSVGEAGVALVGVTLSGALLATAVALALRRRR